MQYRTFSDMAALIRANVSNIPKVDMVVGIPRSGMIAASMIATLTNQRLHSLNEMGAAEYGSILLVDDSVGGGETMAQAVMLLHSWHPKAKLITLAVYVRSILNMPEIYFEHIPGPRIFEWNWFRSKYLKDAVLDIDGVISTESSVGMRDQAKLLYRPARRVRAVATGRKWCDRHVTREWLKKHDVKYGDIRMAGLLEKGRDVKVRAIKELSAKWAVESNIHQAEYIRVHANVPVLCVDANRLLV